MARLLYLVLSSLLAITAAHDEASIGALRRSAEVEVEVDPHRELGSFFSNGFGFSFTNLMFKLGVCHSIAGSCPAEGSKYCGCPNCCRHPQPPHVHHYCKWVKENYGTCSPTSFDDGSSYGYSDYSGSQENRGGGGDGDGGGSSSSKSYEEEAGGDTQGASRVSTSWVAMLTAAGSAVVVVGAAGAVAMNRRNSVEAATAYKAEGGGPGGISGAMLGFGAMAAAAGAAIGLGGRKSGNSSDTDEDEMSGVVSRRMNLLNKGEQVEDLDAPAPKPQFIHVPGSAGTSVVMSTGRDGIETASMCSL